MCWPSLRLLIIDDVTLIWSSFSGCIVYGNKQDWQEMGPKMMIANHYGNVEDCQEMGPKSTITNLSEITRNTAFESIYLSLFNIKKIHKFIEIRLPEELI